jgi:predicted MFS family arabinose efflux permease
VSRLRLAITVVFFVDGALFASWASRIPAFADRTGASTGALGLALLAPAVGAVILMPQVGRALQGRSSRRFSALALVALMVAVALPALASSVVVLGLTLVVLGAANSTLDVSMNVQGMSVERHLKRPILSSLHSAFSFGGFAGATLGALAAAAHLAPLPHLLAAAAVFGVPGLFAVAALMPRDEDPNADGPRLRLRRLPVRLAVVGLAAFCCLLAEGGASDWSAKLVSGPLHGSQAIGALTYAVFSLSMGAGRLVADHLWARWHTVGLLRRSGALAGLGFGVALALHSVPAALVGFAALGLGLSGIVPTLFRSAAHEPGVPAGTALGAVSSLGYLGFLAGPPMIGGVAQLVGLPVAAALLAASAVLVAVMAPVIAEPLGGGRTAADARRSRAVVRSRPQASS